MTKKQKITLQTPMDQILTTESAREVLAQHKVPCLGCPMAQMEMQSLKIGDVCKIYGIDAKKLLADLNKTNK